MPGGQKCFKYVLCITTHLDYVISEKFYTKVVHRTSLHKWFYFLRDYRVLFKMKKACANKLICFLLLWYSLRREKLSGNSTANRWVPWIKQHKQAEVNKHQITATTKFLTDETSVMECMFAVCFKMKCWNVESINWYKCNVLVKENISTIRQYCCQFKYYLCTGMNNIVIWCWSMVVYIQEIYL